MRFQTYPVRLIAVVALLSLMLMPVRARAQDPARVRISGLEKLEAKASEVVDVHLAEPMLKLAARFM